MNGTADASAVRQLADVLEWGAGRRDEAVRLARALAEEETVPAAASAWLHAILGEAERSSGRALRVDVAEDLFRDPALPSQAELLDRVSAWAQRMDDAYAALTGLWNHSFRSGRKRRRERAAAACRGGNGRADDRERKRLNLLLNSLELLLGRTRLASYPIQMAIDPTTDCNLQCRACQHGLLESYGRAELTPELLDRLEDAFPYVDYLHLYGNGEPLLAAILPAMIERGALHGCTVDVLTNGTRLSRRALPWDRVARLGISVDGACEETQRLLRPPARLGRILDGIRQVRAAAPRLWIYAKVTVSRLNVPEIADLVRTLGAAGVNEIALASLRAYHPSHAPLQVRISDRPLIEEQLAHARQAAAQAGVRLVNLLTFQESAVEGNGALDRGGLRAYLERLPLPEQRIPSLGEIAAAFSAFEFSYEPEVLRRAAGRSRLVRYEPAPPAPSHAPEEPLAARMVPLIHALAREAAALDQPNIRIPFCFMPWRLSLADPDGKIRVCDFLARHAGFLSIGERFADVWNGPAYLAIREAMFHPETLPAACRRCTSDCRASFAEDAVATAGLLGLDLRRSRAHPEPADVAALLAGGKLRRHRRIGTMGPADLSIAGGSLRAALPPGSQILVRFPRPGGSAWIHYRGKFRLAGAPLLLGVKPEGGLDLWARMLDPREVHLLGDWLSLPMPPMPLDFRGVKQKYCFLFFWAPTGNEAAVEFELREFTGVAAQPAASADDLQLRHFWLPCAGRRESHAP